LYEVREAFEEAILYASAMGKPIYEAIGFSEIGNVNVYHSAFIKK
jgi:hypothetical protein